MKKIDLSNIPMKGKLRDWKNSIGITCSFTYDDIIDEVKIINYIPDSHPKLIISYDNKEYTLPTSSFVNVQFGRMLNKITSEYKFNINDIIQSSTGQLKIIDRKITYDKSNHKWKEYQIQCLDCGETRWVKESYLINYTPNCLYCNKNIYILQTGVNDISTTHPWAVEYFINGLEEAQQYSAGSGKKLFLDVLFVIKYLNIQLQLKI